MHYRCIHIVYGYIKVDTSLPTWNTINPLCCKENLRPWVKLILHSNREKFSLCAFILQVWNFSQPTVIWLYCPVWNSMGFHWLTKAMGKREKYIFTHCGAVASYGSKNLGKLCFRLWLVTCVMPNITWTNVDLIPIEPSGTNFSDVWIKLPKFSFTKKHLKVITVASQWARWCLKSPASRLFTQPFFRAQSKKKSKLRVTGGEFTGDRWIPRTKGP